MSSIFPTYGTQLIFDIKGTVVNGADAYFSTMPAGANNIELTASLVYELSKDDANTLQSQISTSGSALAQGALIEGFYKPFDYFPKSLKYSRSGGDLYRVTIEGLAPMASSSLSVGGAFVDVYSDSGFSSFVREVSSESELASLELAQFDVVYYDAAPIATHSFWDKVFFVGDHYIEYCKNNGLDYKTHIDSEEKLFSLLSDEIPLFPQISTELDISPSHKEIDFAPSFRTFIKVGENDALWKELSLNFESLTDKEAFCLMAYCEKTMGQKPVKLTLQEPFDKISEYLLTRYSHTFRSCGVNNVELSIVPLARSFVACLPEGIQE